MLNFAKAAASSLLLHLVRHHGAVARGTRTTDLMLSASYAKEALHADQKARVIALWYAFQPTMSLHLLDDPWFIQAFACSISREQVTCPAQVMHTALWGSGTDQLQWPPFTVALESLLNWRNKISMDLVVSVGNPLWDSLTVLCYHQSDGKAIFWKSLPMESGR